MLNSVKQLKSKQSLVIWFKWPRLKYQVLGNRSNSNEFFFSPNVWLLNGLAPVKNVYSTYLFMIHRYIVWSKCSTFCFLKLVIRRHNGNAISNRHTHIDFKQDAKNDPRFQSSISINNWNAKVAVTLCLYMINIHTTNKQTTNEEYFKCR